MLHVQQSRKKKAGKLALWELGTLSGSVCWTFWIAMLASEVVCVQPCGPVIGTITNESKYEVNNYTLILSGGWLLMP